MMNQRQCLLLQESPSLSLGARFMTQVAGSASAQGARASNIASYAAQLDACTFVVRWKGMQIDQNSLRLKVWQKH